MIRFCISSGATHFERLQDLHYVETRVMYVREVRRTSKVNDRNPYYLKSLIPSMALNGGDMLSLPRHNCSWLGSDSQVCVHSICD